MNYFQKSTLQWSLTLLLTAGFGSSALAQVVPNAGSISRDFERAGKTLELQKAPVVPAIKDQEPVTPPLAGGARFYVKGFKISGATVFTDNELQALLKDLTAKELSLSDLQQALERLTDYYRQRDYFVARAYLLAQDVQEGIVAITILEGRVADIVVKTIGELRLDREIVKRTMRAALPADGVISLPPVERGLLLAYDLPGIEARATLSPGTEVGTSTLTLEVTEGPLISGTVEADNFGNRYSGQEGIGATVSLNDPSGFGDQLALRAATTQDSHYGRISYQIPIGYSGWKLGAEYAETHYSLCCEFSALDVSGHAHQTIGRASYPIVRSRSFNLFGALSYSHQTFYNSAANVATSDSRLNSTNLGFSGNSQDLFGGGGFNNFNLSVTAGNLNLDAVIADKALDAATARADGNYEKATFAISRQQQLAGDFSLRGNLAGQLASKNLASAEKFVLGGSQGVRAYPSGEAAGDEGYLASLELAYQWLPTLEVSGFIDYGEVTLHKDPWAGANLGRPFSDNRYSLAGAGVGMRWIQPGNFFVRATLAFPIGDNPGRSATGNDSDGRQSNARGWIQAVKQF